MMHLVHMFFYAVHFKIIAIYENDYVNLTSCIKILN